MINVVTKNTMCNVVIILLFNIFNRTTNLNNTVKLNDGMSVGCARGVLCSSHVSIDRRGDLIEILHCADKDHNLHHQ